MQQLILILHVLIAIAIIGLVLMQHGRGADVGASFGSGSSNTMFGSSGALPFLMKLTGACAVIFFATSIGLSYMASHSVKQTPLLSMPAIPASAIPVAPAKNTSSGSSDLGISFTPSAPADKK